MVCPQELSSKLFKIKLWNGNNEGNGLLIHHFFWYKLFERKDIEFSPLFVRIRIWVNSMRLFKITAPNFRGKKKKQKIQRYGRRETEDDEVQMTRHGWQDTGSEIRKMTNSKWRDTDYEIRRLRDIEWQITDSEVQMIWYG